MDGIDGIASAQSSFVCISIIILVLIGEGLKADLLPVVVLAGASFGFLCWNWPPAKIFMGDVGSGFLGFMLTSQAMYLSSQELISFFIWIFIFGIFMVDSTFTLIRRLYRRERFYEAHRIHAYQCLARRWKSHGKVTLGYMAVNLFWILPIAIIAQEISGLSVALLLIGVLPLVLVAGISGAGRSEAI